MTPGSLSEIAAARVALDDRELDLIDRARHDGATWAEIAQALDLGSRQAAEQRRQRLVAARRARLTRLDPVASPEVPALRSAVTDLHRWIEADRAWDGRFPRAALARRTCALALDATTGPLHTLAANLAADLTGPGQALPGPARDAARRIATALSTRH
ncbi:hypothetical protein ACFYON_08410 [Micromonospora sp. NPDC005686]|uniref:hypothetical protein n=2 Tax=Micromonospora TaxID=1873 RepID=UPI0033A62964